MRSAGFEEPEVARFLDEIARIIGEEAAAQARFGIAVSGGPDSMALLWLAAQAFGARAEAATVDHQLRQEARAEAEMVAAWCAGQNIAHAILTPREPISGSVQLAARKARYGLLHEWREAREIDWLMTAHHADDQAETLLMRLNRASGIGGLSGVRARNGTVLRPLLRWRRSDLEDIVRARRLPHVHDPSNDDMRFDRVAMRARLREADWVDPAAMSRSAEALGEAQEALDWMTRQLAAEHVHFAENGDIVLERTDFPDELKRRLLIHMLSLAGHEAAPRGQTVDKALVQLADGSKTMIGDWLLTGGEKWRIRRAPMRS